MPPVKKNTKGARTIDLNGSRAARLEAAGEPIEVTFCGDTYILPVEMPAEMAIAAQQQDLRGSIYALLGDEQAEKFFAHNPSIKDVEALGEGANEMYGVDQGESAASLGS